MATKKSSRSKAPPRPVIRPSSEIDYVEEDSAPEYLTQEQDDTIRSIVSRFGGDELEIKIYKQLPGGGEQYWYTTDSDQIDEEKIRTVNGGIGGKFSIKIFVSGELQKVKHLAIADAPGLVVALGAAGASDPLMGVILQRMASLEANLQRQPMQREPVNDIVDAMVKMDAMRGGSAPKEMSVETIMKCIELGKSLGGAPVDDSFMGVVKDLLKEVAPVVAPILMAGMRSPAVNGQPAIAADTPGGTEMERAQKIEETLRNGIAFLKKKCMMGSSPDLYLGLILESAEDERFAQLIHIALTQEFAVFAKLDPEIEQPAYVKFFRHIYDGIRSEFSARDTVDDDSGGAGRNAPDPASNVRVIKGGGKQRAI